MYETGFISPLKLHLDEQNPRFQINMNPSQEDIRIYMLDHEDILNLSRKMASMNKILPGERIIVFNDGKNNIVLEGNRRTTIYQMFLNRKLIPSKYQEVFPIPESQLLNEIKRIPIDIVLSREEAMSYLAARHIEGVKTWSSTSKWKISYSYYKQGKSIKEISEYLVLSPSTITSNIRNYKILLRGIENPRWSEAEKEKLNPLNLKPDKLTRIFHLSDITNKLQSYFDNNYNLKSRILSDRAMDELVYILTRRAFIDNTLNTRSSFEDVKEDIEHVSTMTFPALPVSEETPAVNTENVKHVKEPSSNSSSDAKSNDLLTNPTNSSVQPKNIQSNKLNKKASPSQKSKGGEKNLPYFFDGLQFDHLDRNNQLTHGIALICNELRLLSKEKLVHKFPVASAQLTRSIIEHALIYYAKSHKVQNSDKLIWDYVSRNGDAPVLSKLIENYSRSLPNYITERKHQQYFHDLFSKNNQLTENLNWVVHRPGEYMPSDSELIALPRKGLLELINFLIS